MIYQIRKLKDDEVNEAIELAWVTFLQYEAPDYSPEGVNNFRGFIHDPNFVRTLEFYGAFFGNEIVGTIATRNEGNHIALFFVRDQYHKQGIGKKLFEMALKDRTSNLMTVNSSPYAVEVYHKLGFVDTDTEKLTDGIRYVPMERKATY